MIEQSRPNIVGSNNIFTHMRRSKYRSWQQLYKLASKNDLYRELLFLFDLSDKKYNSGLFSQKHDSLMRNIYLMMIH